jgi:phenylpropionate dioxygenase-like ring-hydroxylating dioxygenase large terminal subunit
MPNPPPASLQDGDLECVALERARTLPAYAYVEPAFHEFDLEAVFARSWQPIGRAAGVQKPGDHLVAEIASRPVLAVRGADGTLRGFFNVCKHRAGPLALENGSARQFHCRYHGWTYTLEGRLRSAPEMDGVADFDPSSICLDALDTAEWENLVFAAVSEPLAPFADFFAGIRERIAPLDLTRLDFHVRTSYDLACNWKVYVDNYLEGYHLPHVHPGLKRILDYRTYATNIADWHSWQHSPIDGSQGPYAAGDAFYYFVFPNLMFNILPGRLQTNVVLPLGPERCRVVFDYYYAERAADAAQAAIAEDLRFSDEVQREDVAICERVQKGLKSGAYRAGRLSVKREAGVHHFQNLLRTAYRRALART